MRVDNYMESERRAREAREEQRRQGQRSTPPAQAARTIRLIDDPDGHAARSRGIEAVAMQQQIGSVSRDVIQLRALAESPDGWRWRPALQTREAELRALEEQQRVLLNP